jgi:hypothetical protein
VSSTYREEVDDYRLGRGLPGSLCQNRAGRISHFLDSLVRAHVVDSDITEGYKAMGKDESRERDALDWSENLLGDIDHETR